MKINKLGLLHFGKFENKKIDLNSGINLVEGNNESGKSTIFAFIMGILYGFSKDSKLKRLYDENKEKYKPWNFQQYNGYMEIESSDFYRIERDFNDDNLSFINLTNGKDYSKDEKLTEFSRIKQPGAYLFNVNKDIFSNTVFIGQLNSKVDNNSSILLKNKILNLNNAKDENIDIKKACEILEKKLELFGKETRKNSQIGSIYSEIQLLKDKIIDLENKTIDYNSFLEKSGNLEDDLFNLEKDRDFYNKVNEQKLYNDILEKEAEIEKYKDIALINNDEDYKLLLDIEKKIYLLNEDLNNLNMKLRNISDEKKDLDKSELESDYKKVLFFNKIKNNLSYNKGSEFLNKDISNNKMRVKKLFSMIITAFIAILIVLIISIFTKKYYINLLSILIILFIYLKLNKYKVNKELGTVLEKKKIELDLEDDKLKNEINEYKEILNRYNSNEDEIEKLLKEKLDKLNYEIYKYQSDLNEKDNIKSEIKIKANRKYELTNKLNTLSEKYNVETECLRDYLLKNSSSVNLEKIKSIKNIINIMLDGRRKEDLNHNINLKNVEINLNLDEEIKNKELSLISIREQIKFMENNIKILENCREELIYKENKLSVLNSKRNSILKALNTIHELLENNRGDFLPLIMEKMNEIISKITEDKYSNLFLDNDFSIKIKDKSIDSYVNIESLSNGTIDQIYFAFRIAISEILIKDGPIILDDHFLQYDDLRMENTIKFLNDLKNKRQIILFSAMDRERKCLEKLNIDFNYIKL